MNSDDVLLRLTAFHFYLESNERLYFKGETYGCSQ